MKKVLATSGLGLLLILASLPGAAFGEIVRIGYIGALTGETAAWGNAGLNGMRMTAEKINREGGVLGRKIEVVGMDGMGKPEVSLDAFRRLADEGVLAVVGTNFSSCNIVMAPLASERGVPLIATAATSPRVTVDDDGNLMEYSFRLSFVDSFQGEVLAHVARKLADAEKGAVLADLASDYSLGLAAYFEAEFEKLGGTIVASERARSGATDFRDALRRIAEAEPDVLLIPWIGMNVALIGIQARQLGIDALFLGGDGWDDREMIGMGGRALEGSFFTAHPSFGRPVTEDFSNEYVETFGIPPETEALLAHDGLMWIVHALERAGKVDSAALRDALADTTDFEGLTGPMTIDRKTHDPVKPCSIMTVVNGRIEYVQDFLPGRD